MAESPMLAPLVYTLGEVQDSQYEGVWAPIKIPISALIEGVEGMPGFT